jgi:hypothetical protein
MKGEGLDCVCAEGGRSRGAVELLVSCCASFLPVKIETDDFLGPRGKRAMDVLRGASGGDPFELMA